MSPAFPQQLTQVSAARSFGGSQRIYQHWSAVLQCEMSFGVYLPPLWETKPCPVLYWLSGLTCTEQNFVTKGGAQWYAARYGCILVAPDTSPRGCNLPGEDESWDFGSGAGFYVNATKDPWSRHYRMYDYVVSELPGAIAQNFNIVSEKQGIFGHSMGGHGALVIGLRNGEMFRSISAFAPIVAPSLVPWGEKAFSGYLGSDRNTWNKYDATTLIKQGVRGSEAPILIDQGTDDGFLEKQLQPETLAIACKAANYPLELRYQQGYDHSYYFIATFIGDHFAHHARNLELKTLPVPL
ncbi:MAG: S-formylglutathione hydrolase [Cyanobacteria bacterium P01_C01_bin.89]